MPERKGKEMVSFKLGFTLELELTRSSSRAGGQNPPILRERGNSVEKIKRNTNIPSSILVLSSIKVRVKGGAV